MVVQKAQMQAKQAEGLESSEYEGVRLSDASHDEEVEAWLREQPPEVSVAIAARAALRAVPSLAFGMETLPAGFSNSVALPVFRAAMVPWVAAQGPELRAAANLAAAQVASQAIRLPDPVYAVLAVATTASDAVIDSNRAPRRAVESGDVLADRFAGAIPLGFRRDIAVAQRGATGADLASAPLWPQRVPEEIAELWTRLRETLLSLDEGWEVWTEWYEARLEGRPANEALEVARATIPDEVWQQGPKIVNAHISELIARHGGESPDPAGTATSVGPYDTATAVHARTTVWLCQYRRSEAPTLESRLAPGREEPWRMHPLTPEIVARDMRDGDPVVVWRTIDKATPEGGKRSRGGIVATASIVKRDEDIAQGRIRIRIREAFPDEPVPRDEVLEVTRGVSNWPGQVSMTRLGTDGYDDEPEQINALLLRYGRQPLFQDAVDNERADLGIVYDRPESEADYLGRSDLALLLAIKLNQAWDEANPPASLTPDEPRWRSRLRRWRGERIRRGEAHLVEGGFVVHVDAPWGGGKTTFANYVARLLNPYVHEGGLPDWPAVDKLRDPSVCNQAFRKPWICVQFNAWRHQHVNPPWWCFYQAIRRQAFKAIRKDRDRSEPGQLQEVHPDYRFPSAWRRWRDWLVLNVREFFWRLTAPKVVNLFIVSAIMLAIAYVLVRAGLVSYDDAEQEWAWDFTSVPAAVLGLFAVALGGLSALWGIVATFTDSLLPGTPDAARNYEMGSGDPLERFRAHFARMMKRLRRPVLVIIDDLDRCEPRFVVELLRGIQTILRSPCVVFLILGDRDWIEQAFSEHHKAMKGIDVGPEHSFGARFVEKAIQLSLVLPDVQSTERMQFVRQLLRAEEAPPAEPPPAEESKILADVLTQTRELATAPSVASRDTKAEGILKSTEEIRDVRTRARVVKEVNREAALLSAADKSLERETKHRLVPLSPVLPSNPRQIKRIINAVALFQEIARLVEGIRPGTDDWRRLAQWVVLMTEYPQTWFTLSRFPGLADKVLEKLSNRSANGEVRQDKAAERGEARMLPDGMRIEHWASLMAGDRNVRQLLRFDGWDDSKRPIQLDSAVIERFRMIMPATSGSLLPGLAPAPPQPSPSTDPLHP